MRWGRVRCWSQEQGQGETDWRHAELHQGAREPEVTWGHAAAPTLRGSSGEPQPKELAWECEQGEARGLSPQELRRPWRGTGAHSDDSRAPWTGVSPPAASIGPGAQKGEERWTPGTGEGTGSPGKRWGGREGVDSGLRAGGLSGKD